MTFSSIRQDTYRLCVTVVAFYSYLILPLSVDGAGVEDFPAYIDPTLTINPASMHSIQDLYVKYSAHRYEAGTLSTVFLNQARIDNEAAQALAPDGSTAVEAVQFEEGDVKAFNAALVFPWDWGSLGVLSSFQSGDYSNGTFLDASREKVEDDANATEVKLGTDERTIGFLASVFLGRNSLGVRFNQTNLHHEVSNLNITSLTDTTQSTSIALALQNNDTISLQGASSYSYTEYGLLTPLNFMLFKMDFGIVHRPTTSGTMELNSLSVNSTDDSHTATFSDLEFEIPSLTLGSLSFIGAESGERGSGFQLMINSGSFGETTSSLQGQTQSGQTGSEGGTISGVLFRYFNLPLLDLTLGAQVKEVVDITTQLATLGVHFLLFDKNRLSFELQNLVIEDERVGSITNTSFAKISFSIQFRSEEEERNAQEILLSPGNGLF